MNWLAVSGTGTANSEACNGDVLHDLFFGYAVSGTGNASGCHAVSVAGHRVAGAVGFRGQATLPQFPCPSSVLAGGGSCSGSFSGNWAGNVSGTSGGAAFSVGWTTGTTGTGSAVNATFGYSELLCLAGVETVAGVASGSGSASAGPGQVIGEWLTSGETVPRAVTNVTIDFGFTWARVVGGAVLTLNPTTLNLDVAGLGPRTVVTGTQVGAATFVIKSADGTTVPLCSTPLTNVQGEIAGTVPLAS